VIAVLLAGCGSKAKAPAPAAAATAPDEPVAAIDPAPDGTAACARACYRYQECIPNPTWGIKVRDDCYNDCLVSLDPGEATRYGDCLAKLRCQAIEDSMTMNQGPAGTCYVLSRS
jgi:hypothetical protein